MDFVFSKEFPVLPSVCDASGRLSYPGAFECFMDIATQHADVLGVGLRDLSPKNLYWLTADHLAGGSRTASLHAELRDEAGG